MLEQIPFNTLTWTVGTVAVLQFGFRCFKNYRQFHNPMMRYFGWFCFLIAGTTASYAVPTFFTRDAEILRIFHVIGTGWLYAALAVQIHFLWDTRLRPYVKFPYLLVPFIAASVAAWVVEWRFARLVIQDNFIHYTTTSFSSLTQGLLLVGILVPIGYFFIQQAKHEKAAKEKLRSVTYGVAYIVGALTSAVNEFLFNGGETVQSSLANLCIFVILLIVSVWTSHSSQSQS